jgi:hypothetical protein
LYLAHVFQLSDPRFWNAGLSYWLDPYFINVLLEHWYVSLLHGSDPSSPPMYYPAQKTLGYSHGLILYAPFYVPLRLVLHPFQAHNWTVFLAMATGIICLYVLFRKLGLSLVESLAVAALFFTSRNVINEPTSAWTQRASVFLIPPILLMLLVSARMHKGRSRIILAGLAGFLSTLMYVQDFYTAHFALFFAVAFAAAATFVEGGVRRVWNAIRSVSKAQTPASRVALIVAAIAGAWTWSLWTYGGGKVYVLGFELRSHDLQRPGLTAVAALVAFLWMNRRRLAVPHVPRPSSWSVAVTLGAAAGSLVFLWIYARAYLEHRAFPEDHLLQQLLVLDPSTWSTPLDVLRSLKGYDTLRSFTLALILVVLAWIPRVGAGSKARIYWLWFLGISFLVLLIPLRFPEFSVWRAFVEPLPGFAVIRDPKRVVYLYELATALVTAVFLANLPAKSLSRAAVTLLVVGLIVTERPPDGFRFRRSIAAYERWVAAPIATDPSCRSFYIKGASDEYMSRSDNMWGLYGIDSIFVALNLGIPTLNGYSAWFPEGWSLLNPHEAGYDEAVKRWIDQHQLTRVCEFDIDARTMTPRLQHGFHH